MIVFLSVFLIAMKRKYRSQTEIRRKKYRTMEESSTSSEEESSTQSSLSDDYSHEVNLGNVRICPQYLSNEAFFSIDLHIEISHNTITDFFLILLRNVSTANVGFLFLILIFKLSMNL